MSAGTDAGGDQPLPRIRRMGAKARSAMPRGSLPDETTGTRRDTAAGEDRYRLIAETAYFRAERRGFEPGRELDDWLMAEVEVDEMLGQIEPRV